MMNLQGITTILRKPLSLIICLGFIASGCAVADKFKRKTTTDKITETNLASSDTIRPVMRTGDRPKLKNTGQITVAEAAKVTDVELKAAVAKPVVRPERDLGNTVAGLGMIDKTGFWLQTPLVKSHVEGRVVYLKTGSSINLTLIPNGAVAGSGSQISIAAMKVLGIPIVELAELGVFIR